jgi:hypothetical protein
MRRGGTDLFVWSPGIAGIDRTVRGGGIMAGRLAKRRLSHRWCGWCGDTIQPPAFILTEEDWAAWPGQLCSAPCADELAAEVWREHHERQRASATRQSSSRDPGDRVTVSLNLPGGAPVPPGLFGGRAGKR